MDRPDSHHHLHHLLWECYAVMTPVADEAFEDSELTLPLAGTLDMIATWPGVTASEIARIQPKTQQAVSQLVTRLLKLDYIERRLGSGRGVGLYLTPAGEAALVEAVAREERIESRMSELMGPEMYEELRDTLERARAQMRNQDTPTLMKVSEP